MGRVLEADYDQLLLLPPSVEDWVGADHPARFVRDFVDALDLESLGFAVPEGRTGRPPYAPGLLLKAWLYGYFRKIRSARALEAACCDSMGFVWLTGNLGPDHNTLWRFWHRNREALKAVFRQSVRVAVRADLVDLALQAVDGTKMAAQASTAKAWHKKGLEERLAKLDEAVAEIADQVARAEEAEAGGVRLPEAMADAARRREAIASALAALREAGEEHLHPDEPEARIMRCAEGRRLGYNAQAVTEASHRLVVAAEVTGEANDYGQLAPMLREAKETVGRAAAATVADSGYCSGEQLARAEAQETPALVTIPKRPHARGPGYAKSAFRYDAQRDAYICPHGQTLPFERTRRWRGKHESRVYRCAAPDCPRRGECTRDRRGRAVEREPFPEAMERQRRRQEREENRLLMRRRGEIAELPFARVKHLMEFRRWTARGLRNARAQWAVLCTTLNLKVLYGLWRTGRLPASALSG